MYIFQAPSSSSVGHIIKRRYLEVSNNKLLRGFVDYKHTNKAEETGPSFIFREHLFRCC